MCSSALKLLLGVGMYKQTVYYYTTQRSQYLEILCPVRRSESFVVF